jgi:hypothetical protein
LCEEAAGKGVSGAASKGVSGAAGKGIGGAASKGVGKAVGRGVWAGGEVVVESVRSVIGFGVVAREVADLTRLVFLPRKSQRNHHLGKGYGI